MWQELEHQFGHGAPGTKAGRFAFVAPGSTGDLLAGIFAFHLVTRPTNRTIASVI
jgi:hypothetical protein